MRDKRDAKLSPKRIGQFLNTVAGAKTREIQIPKYPDKNASQWVPEKDKDTSRCMCREPYCEECGRDDYED